MGVFYLLKRCHYHCHRHRTNHLLWRSWQRSYAVCCRNVIRVGWISANDDVLLDTMLIVGDMPELSLSSSSSLSSLLSPVPAALVLPAITDVVEEAAREVNSALSIRIA